MSFWLIICLILFLVLVFAAFAIVALNQKVKQLANEFASTIEQADRKVHDIASSFEDKERDLEARHVAELSEERLQHEKELQRLRERIESRRDVLSQMDDKTLLVDMMVALEGYGGRFDRLENILDASKISDRIQEVSSEVSSMLDGMSSHLEEQIGNLDTSINLSMSNIDVSQLMERINCISSDISETEDVVRDICNAVDDIKDSVTDEYDYNSLLYVAKEAQSDASSARSYAEEARDASREARDAAQEARDAADSARYTIDSHY